MSAHVYSYHVFPCPRKENNNVFVDDLKEGEKRPIPNPCRTFLETYQSYPEIMENIERVGFTKPTPIQVWVRLPLDHWVESLNTDESRELKQTLGCPEKWKWEHRTTRMEFIVWKLTQCLCWCNNLFIIIPGSIYMVELEFTTVKIGWELQIML